MKKDFEEFVHARRWFKNLPVCSPARERRDRHRYKRSLHRSFRLLALAVVAACAGTPVAFAETNSARATVVVVVGAAGETDYGPNFSTQAEQWEKACQIAGSQPIFVGRTEPSAGAASDYAQLQQIIANEPKEGPSELWLVLIGHGTFDGKEAKFNLRGPDVSATELTTWLKPFQRPLAVINTGSASAPFLGKLTGENRVIITATRSGNEQNFARFGQFLAATLTESRSDLDQGGQTSLLEGFLSASAQVAEFYKTEGRLATEHALLDDNGDGLGTPADWFRGTRATKQAKNGASLDGTRARQFHLIRSEAEQKLTIEQRARRDELELAVENLRVRKAKLGEEEYYRQLEALLLELAKVYTSPAVPGT